MWGLCCLISGVSTFGGPQCFLGYERDSHKDREDLLSGILSRLLASKNASLDLPPENELRETLADRLLGCVQNLDYTDWNPITKSMHTWNNEIVVIGPDGTGGVQFRVCSEYSGWAWYKKVLSDGEWEAEMTGIGYCSEGVIFMDRRCWSYLKSWIALPPHLMGADSEVLFYTEFFELFKGAFYYDHYPSTKLDYSPLRFAEDNHQEPPIGGEIGVKHALKYMCLDDVPKLRQALCRGLRGKDLGTALLDDFQLWAFESPDIWPCWSGDIQEPVFTTFTTTSTHPLASLPFELLVEIFVGATPYDVLNMASTCKSLRQFLVRPDIFLALLQEMVLRGSLRWLNPCSFIESEVNKANQSLSGWLPNQSLITWKNNQGHGDPTSPFQAPGFPFLAFVYTCLCHSFSMRSRRRLWGIIKQVEMRWIAFRNGKQLGGEDDPDKWLVLHDSDYNSEDDSEPEDGLGFEEEDGGKLELSESEHKG
ncbi:hypothetical protein DL96DRAFT_1681642 [Flagelloscypha sp. PMI_526]|nr:hypothetical protein DL96DRAFT_1681642 [Flagelloscypha sp. PMI_526]